MKHSHHFLALLPLFTILTMSPMQLKSNLGQRSIASFNEVGEGEVKVSAHPKYEARAAKIDKSKIEIDADLDLNCFSERGDDLRKRLMEIRKDYKVDVVEKGAVELQKIKLQGLVEGLVHLEVDFGALKEKKVFEPAGEEIASNTMNELKTTLESLLIDELENDFIVLKEEVKQKEEIEKEKEEVIVKEEPKKEESEDDKRICELEDKNKALNEQVEKLLADQKKILETMLGMNNMMIQMQQNQQQQQPVIPSWLMAGSLVNPQFQYPYMASPTVIMINNGTGAADQSGLIGGQLGQQNYQQNLQSGQYQLQQQPSFMGQNPYMPDPRYSQPAPIMPGSFGNGPFQFSFGPTQFNQAPIQTA